VLLGTSPMHLAVAGFTGVLEFRPDELANNSTYYWKVITISGLYTGDCISGLQEFTIDPNFIPIYRLAPSLDVNDILMDRKQNTSFNLSLRNDGNTAVLLNIDLRGSLAQFVYMKRDLILGIGENITLEAMIKPGSSIIAQPYNLILGINHPGGVEELVLRVNVTDETVVDVWVKPVEPDSQIDWFWLILDVLVIIVLILGLGVLFRSKKKVDEDKKIDVEPEQRGGHVYVVGGLKDDHYEGTRETGLTKMMRSDTDLFGRGNSNTISGIRPPNWLGKPENDPAPQFMENIPEDLHEMEENISEVHTHEEPESDVHIQVEPEKEELPPRAPRWHALSKVNDTPRKEKDVTDKTSKEKDKKRALDKTESEARQESDNELKEHGYDNLSMDFFFEKTGEEK